MKEKIKQVASVLGRIVDDASVPRNIRRAAAECKERLRKKEEAMDVRTASVIFKLDDMANDPNIPLHGRTLIWNIISQLEQVKFD